VTFGAYMGVALALGLVLVLLGLSLKLLQRLSPGTTRGRVRVPMEIVQRMSVGPKQGIAVVRIGERVIAMSVGEGGIRRLYELDQDEAARIIATSAPAVNETRAQRTDFRAALTGALKSAGLGGSLVLLLLAATASAASAQASSFSLQRTVGSSSNATLPFSLQRANAPAVPASLIAPLAQGAAAPAQAAAKTQAAVPLKGAAQVAKPAVAQAAPVAGATLALQKLAPSMDLRVGADSARGGLRLSGTVGIVVMMGLLTLLPTLLLMMTSFTRILIVLHFLRQALGTQNAPPAQLVAAIALMLTGFVMAPTLTALNRDALQPWMAGQIEQGEMLERGAQPFRVFMLKQTRDHDLQVFVDLSRGPRPATAAEVPLITLMSAFVTSELRTAFQIGFALFLPFIIIDVVVSSVLMSMGMFMLPPAMISLPFKLLLFVLVDGWTLIVQSLVASFK
jgi:flagellar biosynthetic protein FliP